MQIKVFELAKGLYQVEAGKRAVVTRAKNKQEALKKFCKRLGIECEKILLKASR